MTSVPGPAQRKTAREIRLQNVRVNNLRDVDLVIPHGDHVVFCGLSGSGKSSLAFDTLYAEGQRRYIDCLSPKTRQFIVQLEKPDADSITGIPPAIAVQASGGTADRLTTVASATELLEPVRLLYSRLASIVCPRCQISVARHDAQSIATWILDRPNQTRLMIAFQPDPALSFQEAIDQARRNGFVRAIIDGETVDTSHVPVAKARAPRIVVDRIIVGSTDAVRIRESIETALQFGADACVILVQSESESDGEAFEAIDDRPYRTSVFAQRLVCGSCGLQFPTARPNIFNYQKADHACPTCSGTGMSGDDPVVWCQDCHGKRLGPVALAFQLNGLDIGAFCQMSVASIADWIQPMWQQHSEREVQAMIQSIEAKLEYLKLVGLGYLQLNRSIRSLSQGEAQRVALTSCLGSTLINMLYVLDEPSIGLHPHDVGQLVQAIGALHQRDNTVVVVDHEEEIIRSAPRIVELGPGAGADGGDIVFDGSLEELLEDPDSVTGSFLAGRRGVAEVESRRPGRGKLRLAGARGNNLNNIDVEFPLGCLCVVTGVSGAGKSSLVRQTLYGALVNRKSGERYVETLPYDDVFGDSQIDEVILIDHSPIGRSPRSNPVTYVKAFDDIRRTFAETTDARTHNIKANQFSFNVAGGRCDKCNGDGQLKIDMQFLADVYVRCDQCHGTRYRDETLAVRYRDRNIAEVLNLTVREAFLFFRGQPKVQSKLKALIDVGLDYIRLGQPATRLSSGEAQRLKLAVYLNSAKSKRVLFILEEPTTGLHMADVIRLLDCFETLLSVGHSFIIVEHNLRIMKHADWIIDLGPGAAENGGKVVVAGTPEKVIACAESVTGQYLASLLPGSR